MIETGIVAFTTFFAAIGPLDVAVMFAAMTAQASPSARRIMVIRGTAIATAILITFALVGDWLLASLGISLAALRVAGGVLLFLMGIEMVFARPSGATTTTDAETEEAIKKQDISVFPLATPLIAGPGAMGAVILLMADNYNEWVLQLIVIASLLSVLLLTLIFLLLASQLQKQLGITGTQVISRIFGILLAALAVQFIFDGINESGLLGH